MNTINLKKVHTTTTGSLHVQVKVNNHDSGILYLTPDEARILVDTLKFGANNRDVELDVNIEDAGSCFDEADSWEEEG